MRLAAIDAGALDLAAGSDVVFEGHVAAVPKRGDGEVRVRVESPDGRVLVRASEPVPDLPVGAGVRVAGTIRSPGEWERGTLAVQGVRRVLAARSLELTGVGRSGLPGALDAIRERAEAALGRGTEPAAADLLRGFVLGQDDRIASSVVDDFKESGLAHLLAVSGQNVLLLALLAGAVLAGFGVSLRARLVWVLLLIAIYVPVAGAGPSIQRAGIAGAAAVVAALAGRPRSRWYVLLLAAAGTLALNPRASADVGWQLSFAAVTGILLFARPLRVALSAEPRGVRAALAEGVAMTVAATLATAPLMAHHFGVASLAALPANVAALPAVAPVMWLGMLSGALVQLPWMPVEPLTWLAGMLAGYIAQVAAWFASPSWALVEVSLPNAAAVAATCAGGGGALALALRWRARRSSLGIRGARTLAAAVLAGVLVLAAPAIPGGGAPVARDGLLIRFLDVGQGDAILLAVPGARPVLIDAGTPDAGVAEQLDDSGIDRLAAVIVTHPELDHAGGVPGVLARARPDRIAFARIDRVTLGAARAAGAKPVRLAAGDRMRLGRLRIDVLWPPRERIEASRAAGGPRSGDPNELSLVLRVRWRGFSALLPGDAEAGIAPVSPGAVDLLKVAHHGSEDPGLAALLGRTRPQVAVISVGEDNPYGHPAPATLATLEEAGVRVLRTDRDGEIVLEADDGGWRVR